MTNIEKMIEEGMTAAGIEQAWCHQFISCRECPFCAYPEVCDEEVIKIYEWLLQEVKENNDG